MRLPISILALTIVVIVTVLAFVSNRSKKRGTQNRYLQNGNWHNMPSNDQDIYNILLNLRPTDFITFTDKLPTLLETVIQKGTVTTGEIQLIKEKCENLCIIADGKGNFWSIIKCDHPNISFLVYSIKEKEIEMYKLWWCRFSTRFWSNYFLSQLFSWDF